MSYAVTVGDHVSWNTSRGRTRGLVVQRKTKDFDFDGQHFTATPADPAFIVETDKTKKRAAHKPGALHKLSR